MRPLPRLTRPILTALAVLAAGGIACSKHAAPSTATLTLKEAPHTAFSVPEPGGTVGRSEDCAVQITNVPDLGMISRHHAQLSLQAGQWLIEDVGSMNGTFVDGKQLTKGVWQKLRDGDEVDLARTAFVFHTMH